MSMIKIALVHDFLREYGGAERVLEAIHELWPTAPLYTSFVDWEALGSQGYRFRDWDIRTVPVFLIPGIGGTLIPGIKILQDWLLRKFHSPLRFLAPKIWESFDLSGYDVVLSSSGWFMCRGVKAGRRFPESAAGATRFRESPLHICYIHHPPRNLYGYATGSLQQNPLIRAYATVVNFFLRHYDFETAQRVDYFIANSEETKRRVWKFYRRESTVIYPPIELRTQNSMTKRKRSYYLSVGRLTYSKRIDLAILAANKLKLPLKVVGTGKEETYLRSIAGSTVKFLGSVSDSKLVELYTRAKALIFCALDEDFGIVPVEAMAHGTPVIALGQGGVLETVADGETGVLFQKPEVGELEKAIHKFYKNYNDYNYYKHCQEQAKKFSKARFKKALKTFVEEKYRNASSP